MKVVLKTTTGKATTYDVEPTTTIASIKDLLKAEYDVASLRVCHKGKVLDGEKTVQELGFGDNEVLFIAGKKLAHKSVAPVPSSVTATPAATPIAPTPTQAVVVPTVTPSTNSTAEEAVPATTTTTTAPPAPSTTAVAEPAPVAPAVSSSGPPVDQGIIDSIKGMGFDDETLIKLALRAAYMDADRAVDFLLSGVSTAKLQELAEDAYPSAPAPAAGRSQAQAPGGARQSQPSSGLRDAVAGIAQFEQIRQVVLQNPSTLPMVMQQIQQHHPDAFALIQANPQEFNTLLVNGTEGDSGDDDLGALGGEAPAGETDAQGRRMLRPTPADIEPVERLVAIGGGMWDRQAAMVVYLVCNRNEEVAANVLFDNGGMPPQLAEALVNGGGAGGGGGDDAEFEDEEN